MTYKYSLIKKRRYSYEKNIYLLIMFVMIFIFVTGCDNSNSELPTFKELAKINYGNIINAEQNIKLEIIFDYNTPE